MRVTVFGATGNIGVHVTRALIDEPGIDEIVAVARRRPELLAWPKVSWQCADISTDAVDHLVDGADVVVNLAWTLQPSHDVDLLDRVNIGGGKRVLEAVTRHEVPALVHASSVGAYSPAPRPGARVDESWPTAGIAGSNYSRQKAAMERILDHAERDHPSLRIVRLRPALVFQRGAASELKRAFLGPFVPMRLLGRRGAPMCPRDPRWSFQVVHVDDVARAFTAAVVRNVHGAFNIATEPVVTPEVAAVTLGARPMRVPARLARGAMAAAWRARLVPAEPGWIDLAVGSPLVSTVRARRELGWIPEHPAQDTIRELRSGLAERAGGPTPPLLPVSGGQILRDEFALGPTARGMHAGPAGY